MSAKHSILSRWIVLAFVPWALWLNASEPIDLGRLPQAAPALVVQAPGHSSVSRPFGDHHLSQGEVK